MTARWLTLIAGLASLAVTAAPAQAQGGRGGQATPGPAINQSDDPMLRPFRWREIGPVGQGGRVDDLAVVESDPSTFYVGFATGGIWKTTNAGTTFAPIFDTYGTHSIGDLALAPSNPDILYVGTGEPNNRQSSSFGDGMYKSTDAGRTFTHIGLRETQSIARVVVHPTNPDIVWVAAMGHLFGPNPDRGVFKSTDGGRTWRKTLFVDDYTGATEIVIDPSNPNTLFAATYQRQRTTWGFRGGGPGSGIWKSENAGDTWTRVTGNGLPGGTMGRIALDFARSNPNVMYAQIEVGPDREPPVVAQPQQGRGGAAAGGGGRGRGSNLPPDPQVSGIWRSNDKGRTWTFASNENQRPMYYSQLRVDPNNPDIVYVGGVSASKSIDGGKTFNSMQSGMGHVDHHAMWINPQNSQHVIYGNDGSIDVSFDGGEAWVSLRTWAVGQPYHVSVDMRRPYFVCTGLQDNGSWCGPSAVRSGSLSKEDWYNVGGGDGFYTAVDPTDWTIVYSESQNGNINRLNLRTGEQQSIRPRGRTAAGGRGGGGGFGGGNFQPNIVPEPPAGTPFRFNWNTPIVLSPHNPNIVYTGANYFFKSLNRGDTWTMSEDLTKQLYGDGLAVMDQPNTMPGCGRARVGACILSKNDGTNTWGTIITISESPIVPGILWVGTDDGNIQVSRDGGATWTEVGRNVPGGTKEYYVSRVEASYVDPATAYVSVDGHRHNDLAPYVFVTRDYGQTWTSISAGLPQYGNVNTVRQDPKNANLLYVGTEFNFFISLDEGRTWKKFMNDLPVVRIDDVLVHPRDNDLVLATHGRSIQVMDDITPLQQLNDEVMTADAHLFEPRSAVLWKNDRTRSRAVTGSQNWRGPNAATGTAISYYLRAAPAGDVRLTITDLTTGTVFRNLTATKEAGINRVQWNLRGDPPPQAEGQQQGGFGGFGGQQQGPLASPGVYRITLSVGGRDYVRNVVVEEDVWLMER